VRVFAHYSPIFYAVFIHPSTISPHCWDCLGNSRNAQPARAGSAERASRRDALIPDAISSVLDFRVLAYPLQLPEVLPALIKSAFAQWMVVIYYSARGSTCFPDFYIQHGYFNCFNPLFIRKAGVSGLFAKLSS